MLAMCRLTVWGEMTSACAISLLLNRCARSAKISCSRSVRGATSSARPDGEKAALPVAQWLGSLGREQRVRTRRMLAGFGLCSPVRRPFAPTRQEGAPSAVPGRRRRAPGRPAAPEGPPASACPAPRRSRGVPHAAGLAAQALRPENGCCVWFRRTARRRGSKWDAESRLSAVP